MAVDCCESGPDGSCSGADTPTWSIEAVLICPIQGLQHIGGNRSASWRVPVQPPSTEEYVVLWPSICAARTNLTDPTRITFDFTALLEETKISQLRCIQHNCPMMYRPRCAANKDPWNRSGSSGHVALEKRSHKKECAKGRAEFKKVSFVKSNDMSV